MPPDTSGEPTNTTDSAADKNTEQSPDQKKQSPEPNSTKKTEKKSLKKIFYGVNEGENLNLLTLITTSPLTTYWGEKTGKPKARVARVIYRLTKDDTRPDTYLLSRQEGQHLDFDTYSPDKNSQDHTYIIAKDIKRCVVTYEIGVEKESTEQSTQQSTTQTEQPNSPTTQLNTSTRTNATPNQGVKPEIEYKTFPEWNQEETAENKEEAAENKKESNSTTQKPPLTRIPHTVTVELTLWDHEHKRETAYTLYTPKCVARKQTATSTKTSKSNPPSYSTYKNAIYENPTYTNSTSNISKNRATNTTKNRSENTHYGKPTPIPSKKTGYLVAKQSPFRS